MRITSSRVTSAATVLGLVVGASIAVERSNARAAAQPQPSPVVDLQAAIDRSNATYLAALQSADARAYASLFVDDALQLPARGPMLRGRSAIAAAIGATFERVSFVGGSLKTLETRLVGPTAYEVGTYAFSLRDRIASAKRRRRGRVPVQHVSGRYLVVWKQVAGEWKMALDFGQPAAPLG